MFLKNLYHYFLIKRSGLFDCNYYLQKNNDVRKADMDPIWHFVRTGWKEGRSPSTSFDTQFYLNNFEDVKQFGINPLIHYIKHGKLEGRATLALQLEKRPTKKVKPQKTKSTQEKTNSINECIYQQIYQYQLNVASGNKNGEYVNDGYLRETVDHPLVKLIAFYLPQYHPIPENDLWWGKGFTEWTNVSKAVPQFLGHYQPRLPGELGFYDLRIPDTMQRQIELAKKYGIFGFCFHYYWFSGKRLLEKPLNIFLQNPDWDFPFCICWANENWTRRWDGLEDDILISQTHDFENDKKFIADLAPILKDPRYIKIGDRPLIIVYRPSLLADPQKAAQYWRQYCIEQGIGDPIIIHTQAFDTNNPKEIGFDAAVEFPPNNLDIRKINGNVKFLNPDYQGYIYDYRDVISKMTSSRAHNFQTYRTVIPSWDNEPRQPGRGHSIIYSTPELYKRWLEDACINAINNFPENERFVFINAWNEWAESAYLEPDRRYGFAYLKSTYQTLLNMQNLYFVNKERVRIQNPIKMHETAVILHVYYLDLFIQINKYLEVLDGNFDIFISIPKNKESYLKTIFEIYPDAYVFTTDNQGRDIGPFIEIYRRIYHLGYNQLLKLHTKKSLHRYDGHLWREEILQRLLGSKQLVDNIYKEFKEDRTVGIIGPEHHVLNHRYYWGSNKKIVLNLAKHLNIVLSNHENFHFIAGSMFWANFQAMAFLNQLPINISDFEQEPIPPDGTLAHAMERFLGLAIEAKGFVIKEIDPHGDILAQGEGKYYRFGDPEVDD